MTYLKAGGVLLFIAGTIVFADVAIAQTSDLGEPLSVSANVSQSDLEVIPVHPQADPTAPVTPDEAGPKDQIEEVMVTATKRSESARDIPLSINAIKGEDLERQGARDVKDYLMQVPGITFDEDEKGDAGGRRFTIRGVGPFDSTGNQAVGQFIGDVPLTDPVGNKFTPDLDPFDLSTVEVLKGPQGTSFGGTALNGAIRYVPNAPDLGIWSGRGFAEANKVTYGGIGSVYGLAGNAAIGDSIALRGSGVLQDAAGLYDNLQRNDKNADTHQKWSLRGQALFEPIDSLTADLLYLKQKTHADDVLYADQAETYTNDGKPGPSSSDTQFSLAELDLRYAFAEWGTLVYEGGYQKKNVEVNEDSSVVYVLAQEDVQSTRAYTSADITGDTQEFRWVSPNDGVWKWVVGAFYMKYNSTSVSNLLTSPADLGNLDTSALDFTQFNTPEGLNLSGSNTAQVAQEKSFYGELARKLGDIEVTVGARRYDTQLHALIQDTGAAGPILAASNGNPSAQSVVNQKETGISPKVSVSWRPNRDFMMYATVSRGFQFGGTNTPPLFAFDNPVEATYPLEYGSSTLWNREVGVRTDWFGRTLRLDTTFYDIIWNNAQVSQNTSQGHVLGVSYTENVGKVRSQGIENSLTWLTPIHGLSYNLNLALNKARTAEPLDADGTSYPSGTTLPVSPHVQVSTALNYTAAMGPWINSASANYTFWSAAYSNLAHQFNVYDFGLLGLNFSTSRPDWVGSPSLTLGVSNLLNEQGVLSRFGGGVQGEFAEVNAEITGTGYTFTRPRTISLRLTAEF